MSAQNDIPVEVQGYKTDPLRRGYQILWNYENIYWRALVGNDAWSLYEVLRGFCHEGKNICNPSINLLTTILGLQDKRVLIGRVKKTKGKEYKYPGLIEILQHYELVTAEVKGEWPKMRYVFHVNLTPGLLTSVQLSKLPKLLQKKHDELLKRCEQDKQRLKNKQKPPKVPVEDQSTPVGISQGGVGISHWGSGKFPLKQQQVNNTHKTTTETEVDLKNNNKGDDAKNNHGVVVALINKGISKKVAKQIATTHSRKHIEEEIDLLEWKLELQAQGKARGRPIQDPAAWLLRAIEENYTTPADFKSRAEREAETAAAEQRQQALKEHEAQQQAAEKQKRQKAQKVREEKLTAVKRQYKTTPETEALWSSWLSHIRATDPTGAAVLQSGCELLAVNDHEVVLWVDNTLFLKTVQRNYAKTIKQLAARHLKLSFTEVELTPVIAATNSEEDDP